MTLQSVCERILNRGYPIVENILHAFRLISFRKTVAKFVSANASRSSGCFGLKWWDGSVDGDWFRVADASKFPMQEVVYQDRVRLPHCAEAAPSYRIDSHRIVPVTRRYVRRDGEETCPTSRCSVTGVYS